MTSGAVVGYALAAAAYAGFQLTVRTVVYPQFARVPRPASAAYERAHQRLVTPLVGLLFGALALTLAWCLLTDAVAVGVTGGVLFGLLLLVTALGAVPAHAVLDRGFDPAAHRRLLRWDTVRVVLALAQLGIGIAGLAGAM